MKATLKVIELKGRIDEKNQLHLEESLPVTGPSRVRVIILIPGETEIDEKEWLAAGASNPSFDYLKKPEEDVYSLSDGKPFYG
jgi:hypothetical protein